MSEFDEGFFESLPNDELESGLEIIRRIIKDMGPPSRPKKISLEYIYEVTALVELIFEQNNVDIDFPQTNSLSRNSGRQLRSRLNSAKKTLEAKIRDNSIEAYRKRHQTRFQNKFSYEFSKGDLNRIQVLVNELRDLVQESEDLEDDHKQRFLSRLEKMQRELHKRQSDLDRFWGLVGEAGVVLGKLGTEAKPMVDRIREIAKITWRTQSRAEELPSDSQTPFLEE